VGRASVNVLSLLLVVHENQENYFLNHPTNTPPSPMIYISSISNYKPFLSNFSELSHHSNSFLFSNPNLFNPYAATMSQSPETTSPTHSTDALIPNPSVVISTATPITIIHPSFASATNPNPHKSNSKKPTTFVKAKTNKKTKASSPSGSKKPLKAKNPKSKSKVAKKKIHNMQELYLDNTDDLNVESHV
jgi:hypothetical protein